MMAIICLCTLAASFDDVDGLPKKPAEVAQRLSGSEDDQCWLPETVRKHPELASAEHEHRRLTWIAISHGKRMFLEQLLDAGAEIDAPVAVYTGDIDWLDANLKTADALAGYFQIGENLFWTSGQESLLTTAARGGQAKMIAHLLRRGGKIFESELKQGSLLTTAAYFGGEDSVDVLSAAGAADYAEAARVICSEPTHVGMLAHLIRRFPKLPKHSFPKQEGGLGGSRSYPAGSTLLMHAVDNLGAVEILLSHGSKANAKDAEGRNAIDYIGNGTSPELARAAKQLRAAGAEFSPWTLISFGDVAEIEQAIRDGRLQVNQRIKRYGDANHVPLQIAWFSGRPEVVSLLLKLGADPFLENKTDHGSSLADWIGSGYLDRKCLAALLKVLGPEQMERFRAWRSEDGSSALHRASEKGDVPALRLLLRFGFDKAVKNKEGKTAADLACNEVVRKDLR